MHAGVAAAIGAGVAGVAVWALTSWGVIPPFPIAKPWQQAPSMAQIRTQALNYAQAGRGQAPSFRNFDAYSAGNQGIGNF